MGDIPLLQKAKHKTKFRGGKGQPCASSYTKRIGIQQQSEVEGQKT